MNPVEQFLVCPQCGISRFYVLNKHGERLNVQVSMGFEIKPVSDRGANIEGFNLDILYCLGCSWRGPKEKLIKYLR